jgi:hypothetical protein
MAGRVPGEDRDLWVMNVTSRCDCARVETVRRNRPEDAFRVYIDDERANGRNIFRLATRLPVVIVSEAFKEAVLKAALVGPGLAPLDNSDDRTPLRPGVE